MAEIQDIGRLCKVDDHDMIRNESDENNINRNYRDVIDEVLKSIQAVLEENLHSVYLRGSLPRGLGIEGVSDIDLIVVTHSRPYHGVTTKLSVLEKQVSHQYPWVNGLEAGIHTLEDVVEKKRFGFIPFMIQTHSVCLVGENLQGILPHYKPDHTLANAHIYHVQSHINQAKSDLHGNEDEEDILDCCTWVMKIIVRCGLAFVIEQEHTYTRDLYPAFDIFSKHYPNKVKEMRTALGYAINPTTNTEELAAFLDVFGDWMVKEAETWLNVNNPSREENLALE